MRRITLVLAIISFVLPLAALDFSVSPNADGSFDFSVKHDWSYGEGPLFSAASLDSMSRSESEVESALRIMTVERDFAASLRPIGFKLGSGRRELKAALDIGWTKMNISELGYADMTIDSIGYRLFMSNDRIIDLVLPRLRVDAKLGIGQLSLTMGAEYAPWLWVRLDQKLSTSSTPAYTAPLPTDKPNTSEQSATNAYSLDGSVYWRSAFIEPGIEASFDDLTIKYDYLDALGEKAVSHSRDMALRLGGSLVLRFLSIGGLSPRIGVSREMSWNEDLSGQAGWTQDQGDWKFSIGVAR